MSTYAADPQTFSIGLLVVRVVIGLIMAAHGTQKLLGWFGGYGLRGTGFGVYSLDGLLGVAGRWSSSFTWIVMALGVAGGLVNLALRRRPITTVRA